MLSSFLVGPTLRKLVLLPVISIVLLILASQLGLESSLRALVVVGFVIGMLFPAVDVLTGLIRTSFQTMMLVVLMGAAILLFPSAWLLSSGFCPVSAIHGISSNLDAPVLCQVGLAILLMAAAWVLSTILVVWIPAKNAFHHWTSAVVMTGGIGMLNHIIHLSTDPWPLTIGFGIGYSLHLLADSDLRSIPLIGRFMSEPDPKKA